MNAQFSKIEVNNIKNNLTNLSQLVFEVTDVCNLKCRYCGYGELYEGYDPRGKGNLSLKKACNILDYLANLWNENIGTSIIQPITLDFYGGEPLINVKLIKEIIAYAESLKITGKKFHYGMTTNGLLLDKHMDYIADKEFNLLISLDGNELDHSYRIDHQGKNSHKQIIENVRLLQQSHPDYFKRHVRFNTVLHNMNSVESAHNYIKNNFEKETVISPLNNSGIRKDKEKDFLRMFQNANNSIEKTANREELEAKLFLQAPNIQLLTDFLYNYSGNMLDSFNSVIFDEKTLKTKPTGTCIPFFKKMFITVTGKILQCEKINHEFAVGQVTDEGVEMDLYYIAQIANDYAFKVIDECNTCANTKKCGQCVFQIDEITSMSPKCPGYISAESFQKYINKNLEYLGKNPGLYKRIMQEVQIRN